MAGPYEIYPAVDNDFNFPPPVRQAIAASAEQAQATSEVVPQLLSNPESQTRQVLDELYLSRDIVIDGGSP